MKLNVFCNLYGTRYFVGILQEINQKIFFEYAPDFLASRINLSPFQLPLQEGVFEDQKRTFDGLFGLFNDSLPDGWGCLLLDRKLQQKGISYQAISPLMRLSLIGSNPMGALEYEPTEPSNLPFGHLDLDSLASEVSHILNNTPTTHLDELITLNGSSGGARPKIIANVSNTKKLVYHGTHTPPSDSSQWIIKFHERKDGAHAGETEYAYSLAAKAAGIDMPETHLFPSTRCPGYFGVKRFDRIGSHKIHIHSACGLIHASHRYSSLDYANLLKLTLLLTKDMSEVKKMVRLMIFNVKSKNKDDHSKNFAFMLTPDFQWKLTPAYDLTLSEGINGEQTAMVNGKGKDILNTDLIAEATRIGVTKSETLTLIDQVETAVHELLD